MSTPVLTLTLRGAAGPARVGQPVPIAIEILNVSAAPVWIVGVMDGSEEGIRYPHYSPRVTLGGEVVAEPGRPEDPLVGPLRMADFRRLAPGEAFDPTLRSGGAAWLPLRTFDGLRPHRPGRFELSLELSTESRTPEEWLGRFGQEAERALVLPRVVLVPRLTLRSNVLAIEVA